MPSMLVTHENACMRAEQEMGRHFSKLLMSHLATLRRWPAGMRPALQQLLQAGPSGQHSNWPRLPAREVRHFIHILNVIWVMVFSSTVLLPHLQVACKRVVLHQAACLCVR